MSEYTPEIDIPCEYYSKKRSKWVRLLPKAGLDFLMLFEREKGAICLNVELHKFRPIKTKQDIEREEAVVRLGDMISNNSQTDQEWSYEVATYIYDAGYRLVGEKATPRAVDNCIGAWNEDGNYTLWDHLLNNFDIFRKVEK